MDNTSSYVSDFDADRLSRSVVNAFNDKTYSEQTQADNTMHAADGQFASVPDLLSWISVFMNDGKYQGKTFLTETELEDILASHAKQDRNFYIYHRTDYTLGWDISDFNGERMWSRFGSNKGLYTHVSFMPEHNIGIVAHQNGEGFALLTEVVTSYIYNTLLNKENTDKILEENKTSLAEGFERFKNSERRLFFETTPEYEVDISKYTGTFENELWGTLQFSVNGGLLKMKWGHMEGTLFPFPEDESDFVVSSYPLRELLFLEENGNITGVRNGSIVFTKK